MQSSLNAALANPEAALIEISRLDCEEEFSQFVREAWHVLEPATPLVWNWHLDVVCGYMEAFYERRITRLIINVPPGTMKSLIVSVFYPAWVWAKEPSHRFLGVANGEDLALRDSQRHKWLTESEWYQARWPLAWKKDQSGKGLFGNDSMGFRQAVGITASITGKRGDTMLIDDPHDAEKAQSDAERAAVVSAYDNKLSSRLNDQETGGICLIMQRLHQGDLTGHLLRKTKRKWTVLVIPMEYEGEIYDAGEDVGRPDLNDPRKKEGELLDPKRFSRDSVEALKEDLGDYGTAGQLQQRPVPKGGAIIKKEMWRKWPKKKPLPICVHIFSSYDTAYTEEDRKKASYSARTTWGVFEDETTGKFAMILLEGWHDRIGYPELRKQARKHHRDFGCDRALIEKKASGQSLIQDMKRARIDVMPFNPGRMDKEARMHLASPMFDAGLVYYVDRVWAENIVDWIAAFPNGAPPSGDYGDTVSQAAIYVRRRRFMELPGEEDPPSAEDDPTAEELEDGQGDSGGIYG